MLWHFFEQNEENVETQREGLRFLQHTTLGLLLKQQTITYA